MTALCIYLHFAHIAVKIIQVSPATVGLAAPDPIFKVVLFNDGNNAGYICKKKFTHVCEFGAFENLSNLDRFAKSNQFVGVLVILPTRKRGRDFSFLR